MHRIEHHHHMKNLRSYLNTLLLVALAMVSSAAAQNLVPGTAKVIRIKGPARFTTGNGVWQPLKVGDKIKPGTVIQTSMDKGSFVDLVLGEGSGGSVSDLNMGGAPSSSSSASPVGNYSAKAQQNVV